MRLLWCVLIAEEPKSLLNEPLTIKCDAAHGYSVRLSDRIEGNDCSSLSAVAIACVPSYRCSYMRMSKNATDNRASHLFG